MNDKDFFDAINEINTKLDILDFKEVLSLYGKLSQEVLGKDQRATVEMGCATCLLRAGYLQAAKETLENIELEKLNIWVKAIYFNLLSDVLFRLGQFTSANAAALEAQAIAESQQPTDPEILSEAIASRGFIEAELGNYHTALALLDEADKMDGQKTLLKSIALFKAFCYEGLHEFDMALSILSQVDGLVEFKNSRELEYRKGSILIHKNEIEEAVFHLKRAMDLPPDGRTSADDINRLIGRVTHI